MQMNDTGSRTHSDAKLLFAVTLKSKRNDSDQN